MPEKLSQGPRIGYDASRVGAGLSRGPNKKKTMVAAPWSQTWPAPGATLDLDFANDRGYVRGVGQGKSMDAVTFTRASVGRFVNEQGLLDEADNNVPRFDWASTAQLPQNLFRYTEEFNNAAWASTAMTVVENFATDPNGNQTAELIYPTSSGTRRRLTQSVALKSNFLYTIELYAKESNSSFWLFIGTSVGTTPPSGVYFNLQTETVGNSSPGSSGTIESASNGYYRLKVLLDTSVDVFTNDIHIMLSNLNGGVSSTPDGTNGIIIWGAQIKETSVSSEYQFVGAFAPTNTPLTANPTSNGLLIEESRTNRLLWNRDATDASWVKTDVTAAKDQTGIDGVANAASSLTATADGGTCIQTVTLASGSRTGSVYLKRLTGVGTVQVSLDGSTWSTVDLSSTEWRRIVLSGTVTNPTVGIKIATNGDAVAMDYAQVEDGAFATTPILTTTATSTRATEILVSSSGQWFDGTYGTFKVGFYATGLLGTTARTRVLGLGSTTNNNLFADLVSYRHDGSTASSVPLGMPSVANLFVTAAVSFLNNNEFRAAYNEIQSTQRILGIDGSTNLNLINQLGIGNLGRPATIQPTGALVIKRIVFTPKSTSSGGVVELTK